MTAPEAQSLPRNILLRGQQSLLSGLHISNYRREIVPLKALSDGFSDLVMPARGERHNAGTRAAQGNSQ